MNLAAALLGMSLAVAGCTAVPIVPTTPGDTDRPLASATSAPRRSDQVVALIGVAGAMRPVRLAADGRPQPMDGPGLPLDAAWLSGDGSTLLVTTLGGASYLGVAAPAGAVSWSQGPGELAGNHSTRAFGSLRPSAQAGEPQLALVEGDPGSGGPGRLVGATLAGTVKVLANLANPPDSAPAWLLDGRIVVLIRDASDAPTAVILNPATGRQVPGPGAQGGRSGTLAIGGQTLAELMPDGGVRAGSVNDWLEGKPGELITGSGPDEPVIQAQPSLAGDELALVVANGAGDAASIRILSGSGGWHEIARFELPTGANRAVVSWLAVP